MISKVMHTLDRFVLPETKADLNRLMTALLHPEQDDEQVVNDALTERLSTIKPPQITAAETAVLDKIAGEIGVAYEIVTRGEQMPDDPRTAGQRDADIEAAEWTETYNDLKERI